MCETCEELACRPVILNSMLVVCGPAVSVMVPFDVTVESAGFSLKVKTLSGVGEWLGEGSVEREGEASPVPIPTAPHPVAATRSTATAYLHSALGIPQQVTGAGREFSSGPLAIFV